MNTFTKIASVVFGLVAVVHVLRLVNGWTVQVGPQVVPLWASYVFIAFGLLMAWGLWREAK